MRLLLALGFMLFTMTGYACPELNEIDFASSDQDQRYTTLDERPAALTRQQFSDALNVALVDDEYYKACSGALMTKTVVHKKTKRIFKVIVTNEDHCDGGNAFGSIYSSDFSSKLGEVQDFTVYCY